MEKNTLGVNQTQTQVQNAAPPLLLPSARKRQLTFIIR